MLTIMPAVDIQNGRAVQLVQGVAASEKVFGDPLDAARRWAREGATWLHVVDLDAAFGRGANAEIIAQIVADVGIDVEVTGGIRDDASLERALGTGCTRVTIGTAAVERPGWCDEVVRTYGARVAISLDVRGDRLAARGWTADGGGLWATLDRLEATGVSRLVVTDVEADGMMAGPNLALLRQVCARTHAPVTASGGIATLADLDRLKPLERLGIDAAIVGTALYVGSFTLAQAQRPLAADDEE